MANLHLLGKTPINPDTPTGGDIKYDPDFETLQGEIDKLASPSATEGVNWRTVAELSAAILEEKSKDLLVAAYFAVSRIHVDKLEGLVVGVAVYRDLVETFWDTLYPAKKRMRGRINALEWWIEKTETALAAIQSGAFKEETRQGLMENLAQIQALLNDALPEPVSISPIERAVGRFKTVAPKPEPSKTPPPKEAPPAPPETGTSPGPSPAPVSAARQSEPPEQGDTVSPEDARKALEHGFTAIGNAAHYFFTRDAQNPLGYQYNRLSIWGGLDELPVTAEDRKTIIPPPEAHIVTALKELLEKGDYTNLLAVAESKVADYLFWLDLNYYAAEALKGLGGGYDRAREAVCRETACFIHRFPDLPLLQFADGTPFADSKTTAWIKRIGFGGAVMATPVSPSSGASGDDAADGMEKEIRRAEALAGEKKLHQALALLQSHYKKSCSRREALLWRIALVQLLIGARKTDIALPHVEQILCDIEDYRLEAWDPDLALNGLKTVLTGLRLNGEPAAMEKAMDVLSKIARLDAAAALDLTD